MVTVTGIEIAERGAFRYELDGVKGDIPLDDVLVLAPAGDKQAPTSPPPNALTFYLADGGTLRGTLLDRDKAAPRVLSVDIGQGHIARISFDSLSGIRTRQAEIRWSSAWIF